MEQNNKFIEGVEVRQSMLYPSLYAAEDGRVVGPHNKWLKLRLDDDGYYRVTYTAANKKQRQARVHRVVASAWIWQDGITEDVKCDHKDAIRINNVASNLEWVTTRQNSQNSEKKRSKAGYTGVNPSKNKWTATINLGSFATEEEAARAYDQALIYLGLAPVNNV